MYKKRIALLIILIILLCSLSGCFFRSTETQLDTPVVTLSEDNSFITWNTINNAVYYEVIVNDERHIIRDDNVFYFVEGGTTTNITVRAIGDGIVFKDSEICELNDVTIRARLTISNFNLRRVIDNLIIEWDEVEFSIGYTLDVNGTEYEVDESETSYSYNMGENYDTYIVGLIAIATTEGYYADSERYELSYDYYLPEPASIADGEVSNKEFDKANSLGISFAIDFNDDTTYNLTGNDITSENYTYDGETLVISNAFLRTLELGENVFEFSTEQYIVELTINISDTRTPQLTNSSISFNLENTNNPDVVIGVNLNNGSLEYISLNGLTLQADIDYTYIDNQVIFDANDLYTWEIGEYDIDFHFSYNGDDIVLTFTISVIDTTMPYSEENSKTFDKANPNDIDFNLVLNMEEFQSLQGELSQDDWSYNESVLTIHSDYLMSRPQEEEYFMVYTSGNAFSLRIDIISSADKCYNIHVDTDTAYPDMVLRWEYSGYQNRYCEINGTEYEVISANFLILDFLNKTDTFTYRLKAGSGDWSDLYTWEAGTEASTYLNKSYEFMGETYDYYMSSQEELNNFLYYACYDRTDIDYTTSKLPNSDIDNNYGFKVMDDIYIGFDYSGPFIDAELESPPVNIALRQVPLSKVLVSAPINTPNNIAGLTIIYTGEAEPTLITSGNEAVQNNNYPSHIDELKGSMTRDSSYEEFAINTLTKTQIVETSEQLFLAAQAGVKPITVAESSAEDIYIIAKDVLRDIITDDMSDYDKIHAIYDWLIHTVEYDGVMLDIYTDPYHEYNDKDSPTYKSYYKYNCFNLEGVFEDNLAVCDGFAKAFVLLTRIEGIESIKVNGQSKPLNKSGYVGHAWNKVKLDNNWYVVDSTWGNIISESNNETYEYMTHAYLLVSDMDIYGTHIEDKSTVVAYTDNSYYKNTEYTSGKDFYIETEAEFHDMIDTLVNFGQTTYIDFYNATGMDNTTLMGKASLPLGIHSKGYIPIVMNNGSAIIVTYGP